MRYTNERVTIRFGGGIEVSRPWLTEDAVRAQRVLKSHASERASCLCTPFGVPMHIVQRNGRFHFASMPGRAHHHALSCPSYTPDLSLSGIRHYSSDALSRAGGRHKLTIATVNLVDRPFCHFSPAAALQFIWEYAGLTLCTPKIVASRNYYATAKSIYDAAPELRINTKPFNPYVPLLTKDVGDSNYAIGKVQRLSHGKYANGLTLSADRKTTFWVDLDTWRVGNLEKVLGSYDDPQVITHTWVIGKIWTSKSGNYRLFDVGALATNEHFLPKTQSNEVIVNNLTEAGSRFLVCQRFDADDDDGVPEVIVLDREHPKNIFSA